MFPVVFFELSCENFRFFAFASAPSGRLPGGQSEAPKKKPGTHNRSPKLGKKSTSVAAGDLQQRNSTAGADEARRRCRERAKARFRSWPCGSTHPLRRCRRRTLQKNAKNAETLTVRGGRLPERESPRTKSKAYKGRQDGDLRHRQPSAKLRPIQHPARAPVFRVLRAPGGKSRGPSPERFLLTWFAPSDSPCGEPAGRRGCRERYVSCPPPTRY